MFINPVNKVLDKRPSPTFTRHVIWAWIRLTAPFHAPPHFFKPIPAHARLAKGWSRDVLASWCLTPQLGAATILEPCDQCQDTKPLQELTKCGGIFAMTKKLRRQSRHHPIQLRLGESGHEAIKFTVLVVGATVTPLCVFISSPLAGHLPHLVCNRTIDVMKHITSMPCPAVICTSNWSWRSRRIGSSQWRGGEGVVVVVVVAAAAAAAAPLSSPALGFAFSSFVLAPASSAVAQVDAACGSCAFRDCSGIDFWCSLFPVLHLAVMHAVDLLLPLGR